METFDLVCVPVLQHDFLYHVVDLATSLRCDASDGCLDEHGVLAGVEDDVVAEESHYTKPEEVVDGIISLLVVDEPTAGLDPRERIRFRNLLVELSRNRIVIFSTHIIDERE